MPALIQRGDDYDSGEKNESHDTITTTTTRKNSKHIGESTKTTLNKANVNAILITATFSNE